MKSKRHNAEAEPRNKIKSSSSRQNFKLEAINMQTAPRNTSNHVITQNHKKMQPLHKSDNSKSALLRHLKVHSHKVETEKHDDTRLEHPSPSRHILRKIENGERKKEQTSVENKDTCKNFMIRKKNLSGYAKRAEDQFSKYEIDLLHLPKLGVHQFLLDSQNLKILPHSQNTSNNSNSSHDIKDIHAQDMKRDLLHSSVFNQSIGLKVKPIICKNHHLKEHDEPSLCQHQKEAADLKFQKHIENMIKKVRKSSKSEQEMLGSHLKENNGLPCKPAVKEEAPLSSTLTKPAIDKGKGFSGCKTIRITWGENRIHPVSKVGVQSEEKVDGDDIFGGLSAITHEQAYGREIESLKELFRELNHQEEVASVLSKELIDF